MGVDWPWPLQMGALPCVPKDALAAIYQGTADGPQLNGVPVPWKDMHRYCVSEKKLFFSRVRENLPFVATIWSKEKKNYDKLKVGHLLCIHWFTLCLNLYYSLQLFLEAREYYPPTEDGQREFLSSCLAHSTDTVVGLQRIKRKADMLMLEQI